jgi:AcrR family transcriptional regulator
MHATPLRTKKHPRQARSQETFALIVETTGQLLEEVGFEALSTNLICERANLTPPALYRYFPNKYAILRELGDRIMLRQDEAVFRWLDAGGASDDLIGAKVDRLVLLHAEVVEITRAFPGNIAILRAMRAVPLLRDRRIISRNTVVQRLKDSLRRFYPAIPEATLNVQGKLAIEWMYAVLELVIEEPGPDTDAVVRAACHALVATLEALQSQAQGAPPISL